MIEIKAKLTLSSFELDVDVACEGLVTALFGPSGSGKTTILKIVAGLAQPHTGFVRFNDEIWFDSARMINVPAHHRHIGYVFQDARLFPHLSVRHNLMFSQWVRRQRAPHLTKRIDWDDVIDVLGIAHLLERSPLTLSGGEQQRIALARALLSHPALLLMDEPLAALDAQRRDEILPYIERVKKTFSIPTLYVSHARDEVERIADEIIRIDEGKIMQRQRGSILI